MDLRPIDSIQRLLPSSGTLNTVNKAEDASVPGAMFADIFQSMIDTVKETDADKNNKEYLLAVGELDNPAELTIALKKYETSVALMVQMRDRALEAYNEIMRISV